MEESGRVPVMAADHLCAIGRSIVERAGVTDARDIGELHPVSPLALEPQHELLVLGEGHRTGLLRPFLGSPHALQNV